MRNHGSLLFRDNILQGWFKTKTTSIVPVDGVYGYFTEANWKYSCVVSTILRIATMSENREPQIMLYFMT